MKNKKKPKNHIIPLTILTIILILNNGTVKINLFQKMKSEIFFLFARDRNSLNRKICTSIQDEFLDLIGSDIDNWSYTILDKDSNIISQLNGNQPRIPASNLKLITTAYALDKLGPGFFLKTELALKYDGSIELTGQGDPDLTIGNISALIDSVINDSTFNRNSNRNLRILVYEEPSKHWWTDDWHPNDRSSSYGAAVTRLALISNEELINDNHPSNKLIDHIDYKLRTSGYIPNPKLKIAKNYSSFPFQTSLNKTHRSAPMHALLSLANSESHNFTSEVLYRNAAKTWDPIKASNNTLNWLKSFGIDTNRFVIKDGSGLSRGNRATSKGLAYLLYKMDNHKYSKYYQSSLSIIGVRGTLSVLGQDSKLMGLFSGKTGTLRGIRTISGILNTVEGPIYISVLTTNSFNVDSKVQLMLSRLLESSNCSM